MLPFCLAGAGVAGAAAELEFPVPLSPPAAPPAPPLAALLLPLAAPPPLFFGRLPPRPAPPPLVAAEGEKTLLDVDW